VWQDESVWLIQENAMALTPSNMLPLGTVAPQFRLPATDGKHYSLQDFTAAPLLLVMFICNHCPFVKHVKSAMVALGQDYRPQGVAIVAINSNDIVAYPADDMANMQLDAQAAGYSFPYLLDADQSIAKAYDAACTPDFFLFDGARKLIYRGQLDSSRPGNNLVSDGADLRFALDAALAGRAQRTEQKPSVGCNIKWKPGNQPT
jgi:peroxiredoxin